MAFDNGARSPGIRLEGVTIRAGGRAILDGVTFVLDPSRRTVLLGPNGAGKSVTLRLIKGLIGPDRGRIVFGGAGARAGMGLVFQRPVLLRRSAAGVLAHAVKVAGVPRGERGRRVARLLTLAGLETQADVPARRLSGGEQQRLALVRALAAGPRLLLLDEPTASLDPEAVAAVEAIIGQVHANGVGVVLVTHDVAQARRLADEVVFLNRGRVTEQTPAAEFFERPASAEARAYLAGRLLL